MFEKIDCDKYILIFSYTGGKYFDEIRNDILRFFHPENIIEVYNLPGDLPKNPKTIVGKYSYGPLCQDDFCVAEIGAFCSFADGVSAVPNHPTNYITTHPMIYWGGENDGLKYAEYKDFWREDYYFDGVMPRGVLSQKRSVIGNDVWLGKNVTIINGANIGNGVVAGAGAVINRDIPDYAVVVGAPARIVRYRYNQEQIDALNKIAWWDWEDEKIRECYEDFYLPIDEFIKKHYEE